MEQGVDDFEVDEGPGQSITADNVQSFENVSQEPEFDSGPSEPDFPSNANSNTTFGTVPKTDQRNMNIFLHPEKASCEEINSLIHISKRQFLEFVHLISFPIHKHILLSKYSQAFLFRLKLASNWSFDELGTVFCTDKSTARRIFWNILNIFYSTSLCMPNILNEYTNMEEMFRNIHEAQDPYFTKLFSAIEDPTGELNYLFHTS